jgi:hypothetical protein
MNEFISSEKYCANLSGKFADLTQSCRVKASEIPFLIKILINR